MHEILVIRQGKLFKNWILILKKKRNFFQILYLNVVSQSK